MKREALSLYIHIPFCESKCAYCDFLSFAGKDDLIEGYMKKLNAQIHTFAEKDMWLIESIFLGGGTPSILEGHYITELFETIRAGYKLSETCEITIECNPGTLTEEKMEAYKDAGINRISMGVQSTDLEQLKLMNRIHDKKTVLDQYQLLRDKGFDNINLDIIYGLMDQSLEQWVEQVKLAITLNPEHLSVYSLTIEEGTPFYDLYNKQSDRFPSEDLDRDMYWKTHDLLEEAGYEHYEISNYAKAGKASYHNNVYWKAMPYVGFGLGASSFYDDSRFTTIKDLELYVNGGKALKSFVDLDNIEYLDYETEMEEFMFLGLRRLEGISIKEYEYRFECDMNEYYAEALRKLQEEKLLVVDGDMIRLTNKGVDISNYALSYFLIEEEEHEHDH